MPEFVCPCQYTSKKILLDMSLMLHISNSLKDVNRKVNYNLRHSVKWLRAKRIPSSSCKQNLFFLDLKTEIKNKNMSFRISGQKINIICKTKCFGLTCNEHLTFKCHLKNFKLKLKKSQLPSLKNKILVKFPLLTTLYMLNSVKLYIR